MNKQSEIRTIVRPFWVQDGDFFVDLRWFLTRSPSLDTLDALEDSLRRYVKDAQLGDTLPLNGVERCKVVAPAVFPGGYFDGDSSFVEKFTRLTDHAAMIRENGRSVYAAALGMPSMEAAVSAAYRTFDPVMVEPTSAGSLDRWRRAGFIRNIEEMWGGFDMMYAVMSPLVRDSDVLGGLIADMQYMHEWYAGIEGVQDPVNAGLEKNIRRCCRMYMAITSRDMPVTPEFVLIWSDLLCRSMDGPRRQFCKAKTQDLLRRCDLVALDTLREEIFAGKRFSVLGRKTPTALGMDRQQHIEFFGFVLQDTLKDRNVQNRGVSIMKCRRDHKGHGDGGTLGFEDLFSP